MNITIFITSLYNVCDGLSNYEIAKAESAKNPIQHAYQRPDFVTEGYSMEETASFLDNSIRQIISPRITLLADVGYAECVNAGKSRYNEDEACILHGKLTSANRGISIPYFFIGLFDGHGGPGTSVKASKELHLVVKQSLEDVLDMIIDMEYDPNTNTRKVGADHGTSVNDLIIGALESSLWAFDRLIQRDLRKYRISGGSTSLVALFILDKLYLANTGDSRAAVYYPHETNLIPLSEDHVPNAERKRIQRIAYHHPDLLLHPETNQKLYNRHIFCCKNLTHADIDTPILYKDFYMSGWSVRNAKEEDINLVPLISGKGKNNRLLATVGVTRSIGDHQLFAKCSHVPLKEFLIPEPDVTITDLRNNLGILIMSTDGLWDVLSLEDVYTYFKDTQGTDISEMEMAKELVHCARGDKMPELYWEMSNGELSSGDDISVFVVSLNKPPKFFSILDPNSIKKHLWGIKKKEEQISKTPELSSSSDDDDDEEEEDITLRITRLKKEHFKSDFHRYNLKKKLVLSSYKPISEEAFDELSEISSISASETESEDERVEGTVSNDTLRYHFVNGDGLRLSVFKTIFQDEDYFERKQGGSQSSADNKGRHHKSAGSSLRRYNELSHAKKVQDILLNWKNDLERCFLIFYRSSSKEQRLKKLQGWRKKKTPKRIRRSKSREIKERPLPNIVNDILNQGSSSEEEVGIDYDLRKLSTLDLNEYEIKVHDDTEKKNELITACMSGNVGVVDEALDSFPNFINSQIVSGSTLLHIATKRGHKGVIKLLLSRGADPSLKNKFKKVPYLLCPDKEVRNVEESLKEQAAKKAEKKRAQRAAKKEKDKEVKKQELELKAEQDEKDRFLALSDREKRAIAAEKKRMLAQSNNGQTLYGSFNIDHGPIIAITVLNNPQNTMAFHAIENGVIPHQPTVQQAPIPAANRPPRKQRAHEDEEQGKLFVGGLSWDTTQETLLRYFGGFGEVIDCVVMKNAESGRSRGFGFVTFSDPANIDAHVIQGVCRNPKKTNYFPKVFLGGLPSNLTETDLRNFFFPRYGEVCEVIIMYDQEKKKSRGFGFLSFSDDQAVNRACAEHFVNIQNKQVEIKRAEPRTQTATWNKDSMEQWGAASMTVPGGPPPITIGSPMQHPAHTNGQHIQQASGGGVPHPSSAPQQHTHYSAWGSQAQHPQHPPAAIVPWGHHPPAAPTPPHHVASHPQAAVNAAPPTQWGSPTFASPPPQAAQFPVYHPPPSVTPQPNYWNTQPTPPPQAAAPQPYSAYGSYAPAAPQYPGAPPPHHHPPPVSHGPSPVNKSPYSVGAPDFYHQNTITMGQPPVAMSPPVAYNPNSDLASSLGPQRGAMYSTQPSQFGGRRQCWTPSFPFCQIINAIKIG
ncbi:MSI [Lepeophtheirus salmonis]|uniref:MSI n=1 Tax=Lepeophtheirus salmonis TaxID=72036 RepID=A0A7R8CE27_LEPSM|nr:MSI [Lepeophtheirus salmonis]CAF2791813.1 MSI [Lepeophtheirus salmonis]